MPQTQERTKSDIIREVLAELGCLTENPPTGWHDRVTRALKRQKITAHPTMIYDLRRKEMQRLARQQEQEEFANEVAGPQNGNGNEVGNSQPTLGGITLSQAVEIKSLADQYGGFDSLIEVVSTVKSFSDALSK